MSYNPERHHRRSARLSSWDYSWAWWYHVTIVTKDRGPFFGHIENDSVALSTIGKAAKDCWKRIPKHHSGVELDGYVVMPNHVHGIIIIGEHRRDVQLNVPTKNTREAKPMNMAMANR